MDMIMIMHVSHQQENVSCLVIEQELVREHYTRAMVACKLPSFSVNEAKGVFKIKLKLYLFIKVCI